MDVHVSLLFLFPFFLSITHSSLTEKSDNDRSNGNIYAVSQVTTAVLGDIISS